MNEIFVFFTDFLNFSNDYIFLIIDIISNNLHFYEHFHVTLKENILTFIIKIGPIMALAQSW